MKRPHAALAGLATGAVVVSIAAGTGLMPNPFANGETAIAAPVASNTDQPDDTVVATQPQIAALDPSDDGAVVAVEDPDWRADLQARLEATEAREAALEVQRSELEEQLAQLVELEQSLRDRTEALSREADILTERGETISAREADLTSREEELEARLAAAVISQSNSVQTDGAISSGTPSPLDADRSDTAAVAPELVAADPAKTGLDTDLSHAGDAAPEIIPETIEASAPDLMTFADGPITEVHFELNSAELTPGAMLRAQEAARKVMEMNVSKIRILGFTDRSGSISHNRALSQARAEAVADIFVQSGLSRQVIEVTGMGEAEKMLPISTADGISEPLNRCVGILVEEVAPL